MCGLTSLYVANLTRKHLELAQVLFYESTIRGLHAFGAAWGTPGRPLQLLRSFQMHDVMGLFSGGAFDRWLGQPFLFLGHARYDTSGDWRVLENNQPLTWGNHLLLFNGVIRMSTQAEYEQEFGKQYPHDNDGYIALEMFRYGRQHRNYPDLMLLLDEPAVSFAGFFYAGENPGYPNAAPVAYALRNERRPLWMVNTENESCFCSTRDILQRAYQATGLHLAAPECEVPTRTRVSLC